MFRNVPGCSGMFHVPGFVDALKARMEFDEFTNLADHNHAMKT